MADTAGQTALGDVAARQLANATKTVPQMSSITPRWLVHFLNWVPVEAGIYRVNRVKDADSIEVDCTPRDESALPNTFVDYVDNPREYLLSTVNTVLDIHTRVSDLYSVPHNQIKEQLRLTIEVVKERQESELINNKEYGLLSSAAAARSSRRATVRPRPTTSTSSSRGSGRSPASSLPTPLPSLPSGASARVAASRRRR